MHTVWQVLMVVAAILVVAFWKPAGDLAEPIGGASDAAAQNAPASPGDSNASPREMTPGLPAATGEKTEPAAVAQKTFEYRVSTQ